MRGRFAILIGLILGLLLLGLGNQVHAVIKANTPLKAVEGSAPYIVVGRVNKHSADRGEMVLVVTEDIKGKAPFREIPINLKVADAETAKKNQIEPLLKRFGPDLEILFFLSPRGKFYTTFAYTNGTWFQLQGTQVGKEKDKVVFRLMSAEPYFRKTFKGTTAELKQLLKDHAAGKAKLPTKVDEKTEPGFGPEFMPKKGAWRWLRPAPSLGGGALFGVIPTVALGAPLAILAILFPSIFGGVFVLFRQWMAFITLISLNGTILILQYFGADYLPRGSWWSNPGPIWILMTVFTFICTFWAWRRQLDALSDGEPDAPARTELAVLAFTALSCVVTTIVLWCFTEQIRWSDIGWTLTVVMTFGVVVGTAYRVWSAITKPTPFGSMPIATEGVILAAMLIAQIALVPVIFQGTMDTSGAIEGREQSGNLSAKVAPVIEKWTYTASDTTFGIFASTPLVTSDSVYAAYSEVGNKRGTLVRIDRQTGLQKWEFIGKDGSLRELISSPCLAAGKLYVGEGWHPDPNCHVFCIDAESGDEVWRFPTKGQTESSPTVVNGRVYIGAGNEGIFCLDAKTGAKIWQHGPQGASERIQRFCGGMVVVGNRLYCGSGVDRDAKGDKGETATFCLDIADGKLVWKTPAPFAVWSTPVVKDGEIYVASGNGDIMSDTTDPEGPGGALQRLEMKSGKEKWHVKAPNGIIEAPVVDAHRIYYGCRDMHLYCLNRADGKQRWKYFLQSPIVASPVLDCDPVYERSVSVFVATTAGKVCCMTPQTGEIVWQFDLTSKLANISTSPRLVVTRTAEGYTRQLYFGGGIGGGPVNIYENRPVFYCLEDKIRVE